MSYLGGAASGGEAAALEQQKLPAPEQAVIKSANECQICGEKFMVGQSFSVRAIFAHMDIRGVGILLIRVMHDCSHRFLRPFARA
jgi:hypothetical protein